MIGGNLKVRAPLNGYAEFDVPTEAAGFRDMQTDQIVINREAGFPCKSLCGNGPESTLRATKDTQTKKPACVIVTQDYGKPTAMWSSGEFGHPEYLPAVLRPVLKDFTVCGYDETGTNYKAGGVVNNEPGKWNPAETFPDLYGGIFLQASGAIVDGITAFYFPGTAFSLSRCGAVNAGAYGPYDVEKFIIRDCDAHRCYRGFNISVIDSMVGGLQGYALRDYGVKFSAGSTHIDGTVHFWGVSPGPAVWFAEGAGGCWGGPFYVENSPTGILIESSGNTLGPIYSKVCQANIKIRRERNVLGPIDLEVSGVGVSVYGQFNKILGGTITLPASANSCGVQVESGGNSGNGLVVRDLWVRGIGHGKGFTSLDQLNNCTIHAHFQSLTTGLDLSMGGSIGVANDINITTTAVTVPIALPPAWDHNTNRIIVNGIKL